MVDGEIRVRGPMLCRGYTDAALTAEAFDADGFFRTGDLGHLRADGHVVLTGRSKELIIRKGENISPREIEDLLADAPERRRGGGDRAARRRARRARLRGGGDAARRGAARLRRACRRTAARPG